MPDAEYLKAWHARNPGKRKQYAKTSKARNPNALRLTRLKSELMLKYGLAIEDYLDMDKTQKGCCAICKGNPDCGKSRLSVDHEAETGLVRALLCDSCNRGIGSFKHNSQLLREAADYLDAFRD